MSLHVISVLVLTGVSVYVLSGLFSGSLTHNKIVLTTVILLFLLPSVVYLLPTDGNQADKLLSFVYSLENTLAYAFLIVLFWGLTTLTDTNLLAIALSVAVSLVLIWATWDPKWRPLQSVIRSFCVLFAMLIATFALIRRQKNGIWMVLALLSLAFALKPQLLASVANLFESHNYLKAMAILFTGRAVSSGDTVLFR